MKNLILILGEENNLKDEIFQMMRTQDEQLRCLFNFLPYFLYQNSAYVMCFPGMKNLQTEMLQIIYKFQTIFSYLHIGFVIQGQNGIDINKEIENITKKIRLDLENPSKNIKEFVSFFTNAEQEKSQNSQIKVHNIINKDQIKSKQYLKQWLQQTVQNIQPLQFIEGIQKYYETEGINFFQKFLSRALKVSLLEQEDICKKFLDENQEDVADLLEVQYQYESELQSDLLILAQHFINNYNSQNKQQNSKYFSSFKYCDICKELFFSQSKKNYRIKFIHSSFELDCIEQFPLYCPNQYLHNITCKIYPNVLLQVIFNKYLKQFQELNMKNLTAGKPIQDLVAQNEFPILLIGNNDQSKIHLINLLCSIPFEIIKENQNQSFFKYTSNENQIKFFNTKNFEINSEDQIQKFSQFFTLQPIIFIFYVIQNDRLDTIKRTLFELMKKFVSINKSQQGIIIINKEELYSKEKEQEIMDYFSKIISNTIIIFKEAQQEQILNKIKSFLSNQNSGKISFEKTIFAQDSLKDKQERQEIIDQLNDLSSNFCQTKIQDLKKQQIANQEERAQNQKLLNQLNQQLQDIKTQIRQSEKKQHELDNIQCNLEQELNLQESYIKSQKVNATRSQIQNTKSKK